MRQPLPEILASPELAAWGTVVPPESVWEALQLTYDLQPRGEVDVKGRGPMSTGFC